MRRDTERRGIAMEFMFRELVSLEDALVLRGEFNRDYAAETIARDFGISVGLVEEIREEGIKEGWSLPHSPRRLSMVPLM